MSYQAIARKWRPKHFNEIAGQGHVTRTLENAIRLNRVHHAYLFSGPRGVGKTTAARTLARALNCIEGPTITPCGVCSNCKDILSGNSSNVNEIDGASNNSVEDIRELRESVQYLPVGGAKKIYIIDEVHMLSKGAFNALLKTLEEPPAHVVFMFATTEPHKIPDTILSRVQRFDFKRIPANTVVERLKHICQSEEVAIDDDGLRLIARAGEGSMRDSQSLLDQVISFCGKQVELSQITDALGLTDRGLLYEMLEGIVNKDAVKCLEAIEKVHNQGFELGQFSTEMLELLRNATLVALSPNTKKFLDIPEAEREVLIALASKQNSDVFVRSFQVMLDAHERISRSPRPKMTLEMTVAKLVSIRSAVPIDEIVDKIRSAERKKKPSRKINPNPTASITSTPTSNAPAPKKQRPTENPRQSLPKDPICLDDLPPPPELEISSGDEQTAANNVNLQTKTVPAKPSEKTIQTGKNTVSEKATQTDGFQSKSLIQTFNEFRTHVLSLNKADLTIWIEEGAIIGVQKKTMVFEFPTKFTLEQAKRSQHDKALLHAIQHFWPNVSALRADFRKSNGHENHRERSARLKEEARTVLRNQFENNERIQQICHTLSMNIQDVRLHGDQ